MTNILGTTLQDYYKELEDCDCKMFIGGSGELCPDCKKIKAKILGYKQARQEELERLKYIAGFPSIKENYWITKEIKIMIKQIEEELSGGGK